MRAFAICVLAALLWPAAAMAQASPQPVTSSQTSPAPALSSSQLPVFHQDVNLVNVFFTVRDANGALVSGLTKDDFEVLEDGKPQLVKNFSADTDLPITLGLLLDSSGSMDEMLAKEKRVGADFLAQVIRPQDLAFIVSFDTNILLLQDLTADLKLLRKGLKKADINGGGLPVYLGPASHSRSTALYDAIWGASKAMRRQRRRKAIVLLTDGDDEGSRYSLNDAIEAAQMADVMCYVLLLSHPKDMQGRTAMTQLVEATGGRLIEVSRPDKLGDAFAQVSKDLRSMYSLGYSPENKVRDGAFRAIALNPRGPYKVAARKGYYALSPEQAAAATQPPATEEKKPKKK